MPQRYECPYCGKLMQNVAYIGVPHRGAREDGVPALMDCDQCGKTFRFKTPAD